MNPRRPLRRILAIAILLALAALFEVASAQDLPGTIPNQVIGAGAESGVESLFGCWFTTLALIVFGVVVYLLPLWVAGWRRHHQIGAIFALNLLLGWTFVGWVVALVWSLTVAPARSTA